MWFEVNDVKYQRFAVATLARQKPCKSIRATERGLIESS